MISIVPNYMNINVEKIDTSIISFIFYDGTINCGFNKQWFSKTTTITGSIKAILIK
jgi:uncharacterized protein (DUF2225 family)